MNLSDNKQLRMHNQCISESLFELPEQVVSWLALCKLKITPAKWAVALRSNNLTNSLLDQDFAEGKILRTHVLRPTWQLVTPADIGWMLQLSAQRVHEQMAHWYRSSGLDNAVFKKTNAIITKVLRGGNHLTRFEIGSMFKHSIIGFELNNLQLAFIMLHAELNGVVCSGALKGKEHTYALLEERAPKTIKLTRDEALAELTKRYFASHGPATVKDYAWWSSLSVAEVKRGIEIVASQLNHETLAGHDYWFINSDDNKPASKSAIYLLPNFDEYIIGYTDRSAIFDAAYAQGLDARHNPLFQHTIVIDGQIMGTWKRKLKKGKVVVAAKPFVKLLSSQQELLVKAVARYGKFVDLPAELVMENIQH